eukprot:Skav226459  [mRNA]  locus=scaffold1781:68072:70110:+ [translate_table: standard]
MAAQRAFAVQFTHVVLSFLQIASERKAVAYAAMADAPTDCDMQEETAVSCHAVGAGAASTPTTSLASLNVEERWEQITNFGVLRFKEIELSS